MKRTMILSLAAALLTLIGCGTANMHTGMSIDRHSFASTPALPVTFILRDVIEGKELMRIDVPVGKTLVVDLDHDNTWVGTQTGSTPATKIYWEIVSIDDRIVGPLENVKDLPGNDVMMKIEYRPKESVALAKTPTYQPTATGINQAEAQRSAASGSSAKTPVYQPAQPQPAADPAPVVKEQPAPTTAPAATSTGSKVNLPVQQGPAVREVPAYQPQETTAPAAAPKTEQPAKPAEPTGDDLQKALD